MADVKNAVTLHFVWATFDRLPKLTPEVTVVVHQCIRSIGERFRCPILAIGGVEDHIHVLLYFSTTITIADLAKEMKGYSARVINSRFPDANFKWQGGYGVFPVPPIWKANVEEYIANQESHHNNRMLKAFLEETGFTQQTDAIERSGV